MHSTFPNHHSHRCAWRTEPGTTRFIKRKYTQVFKTQNTQNWHAVHGARIQTDDNRHSTVFAFLVRNISLTSSNTNIRLPFPAVYVLLQEVSGAHRSDSKYSVLCRSAKFWLHFQCLEIAPLTSPNTYPESFPAVYVIPPLSLPARCAVISRGEKYLCDP